VSWYQKGKTNLDFTEARDSEWQWHQLGHMQVCTSLPTDSHASAPPLKFSTGWMPFLPHNQQLQSTESLHKMTSIFAKFCVSYFHQDNAVNFVFILISCLDSCSRLSLVDGNSKIFRHFSISPSLTKNIACRLSVPTVLSMTKLPK